MSRSLWNTTNRPPRGVSATHGNRADGHRWNAIVLDGLDLGGVKVVRKGYDRNHFVRCRVGHEYPVPITRIKGCQERGERMECRDCQEGRPAPP